MEPLQQSKLDDIQLALYMAFQNHGDNMNFTIPLADKLLKWMKEKREEEK
jgi:hypothetical protein